MAVATYTKTGTKSSTSVTLDKSIFSLKVENTQLLKQAAISARANARTNLAKTKKRGEVRGGGRKPWRQKGTGRARFGSIRNPIWRGGGIVFGPSTNDNYTKQLSLKSRRQALKQALSLAVESNRLSVIEALPTAQKTSELNKVLRKASFSKGLLVSDKSTSNVVRASANLPNISFTTIDKLSASDVLNAEAILLEKPALAVLSDRLKG